MRQRNDITNEIASKQASIARFSFPKESPDAVLVICNSHRRCTSGKRERGDVIAGTCRALHSCEAQAVETALTGRAFVTFLGGCA